MRRLDSLRLCSVRHEIPAPAGPGRLGSSGVIVAGALVAFFLLAIPQQADAWWACPTDAPNMSVRGTGTSTNVQCTSNPVLRAHDACPTATAGGVQVGTTIRRDYQANNDKCVGRVNGVDVVVLDPTCSGGGPGFVLARNAGEDRCVKPGVTRAPTRDVP